MKSSIRERIRLFASPFLWILPKAFAHKIIWRAETKKKLDLRHPKDLSEKIQYLIVKKYGKREGLLADKYRVKDYVRSLKIDGLNIPRTIAVYDNASDIDLSKLPDKFVLKCNHGCGDVFIHTDKEKFNLEEAQKKLQHNLGKNFAKQNLEYHYGYIKPLIMAEEYLYDGANKNPTDYKMYVFNGVCDRILVCSEREKSLRLDDYDTEWNYLDDTLPEYRSGKKAKRPKNLEKMVKIAEDLCKKNGKVVIPFARVDLYNLDGKIYFGEYTLTPARGIFHYYKSRTLLEMGEKLDLGLYE